MKRHTCIIIVLAAACHTAQMQTAFAGIISDLANATLLEEFAFDDTAGTSIDAAENSVNPGNLLSIDEDLMDMLTNGSTAGELDTSTKTNVEFGRGIVDSLFKAKVGRYLAVMELTWHFDAGSLDTAENEEIRLTILDSGTSFVTAEFEIQREDDNTVTILGNGVGSGSSDISAVVLNGGSLSQSSKFIAVVDANLTDDTFAVHFSSDAGTSFTTLTGGVLSPSRGVDSLRMVLNNDLSEDAILIDRIYLAHALIPEPSSMTSLLLGIALLLKRRQTHRNFA